MARFVIHESDGYSQEALDIYRRLGTIAVGPWEETRLEKELADAEVLVIRLGKINATLLSKAPRLRFIASPTTGLDHIDLAETERRGICVVSLKGCRDITEKIYATSEHTIALILALLRRLPAAHAHVVRDGGWERERFIGREISGKTFGIVGYGRLGSRVAMIAQAMGARLLATDPILTPDRIPSGITLLPLDQLLPQADIVSVHVSLTPETEDLFDERAFAMMRKDSFFVNTSRGQIVHEEALLHALETGWLAGAALDVMRGEDANGSHLLSSPLREYAKTHDHLLLTPHIGGATRESMALTEIAIAEEVTKQMASL